MRSGRLVPVPQGFYLIAPGSWRSLLTTPVFSWRGKLRMSIWWCHGALPRMTNRSRSSSRAVWGERR